MDPFPLHGSDAQAALVLYDLIPNTRSCRSGFPPLFLQLLIILLLSYTSNITTVVTNITTVNTLMDAVISTRNSTITICFSVL